MDNSEVVVSKYGTVYAGPDAVNLFRAKTLKASLIMYARCGLRPSRHITPTNMLKIAKEYTGKDYKGNHKYFDAAADVQVWIDTMIAAMPIKEG